MRVAVVGIEDAPSLNTMGIVDALTKVDNAWQFLGPADADRIFSVELVGIGSSDVEFLNGARAKPSATARTLQAPDVVVVPGLDDDVETSMRRNEGWIPWLDSWHAAGATIATSCTGAFLAAEAGLFDGRKATTHWVAARLFASRYPNVELVSDHVVVDEGDVISSGGATTFLNLVVYLAERYGGHERALAAGKVMLIDSGRDTQLPFMSFAPLREHGDRVVHEIQTQMELRYPEQLTIENLAARAGLSQRTLLRRFKAATGQTTLLYLQALRIEAAKRQLERTLDSVDEIRLSVGYGDPASFRRTFKRHAGVSPTEYRRRYAPLATGAPQ